jgi:DNA processing protein
MSERAALIALLRRPGARGSDIALEVQAAGSARLVLERTLTHSDALFDDRHQVESLIAAAEAELRALTRAAIGVHAFFDDAYPAQLRGIREMPPVLFTRGTLIADDRAVAVVGRRAASERGLAIARAAATALAERGVTVASGLARGIDTAAHRAALAAGGRTVAVIGTGIRRSYPPENRALQDRIAEVGLVLSQFWPDAAPTRQTFPMRNAVMSGYAAATVVVEAGETSGARIQARLAQQHGRPVVLTEQVMRCEWAQAMRRNPGVSVVGGRAELLRVVDEILECLPGPAGSAGWDGFPDLAVR